MPGVGAVGLAISPPRSFDIVSLFISRSRYLVNVSLNLWVYAYAADADCFRSLELVPMTIPAAPETLTDDHVL